MGRVGTSLRYLHHDGHPQRVFRYVFFAFLARSAAAFGIFRLVKLVLLRVRHISFGETANEPRADFGGELSPDDGESSNNQRTSRRAEPACLDDIKEWRRKRRALTPSPFSFFSPLISYPPQWSERTATHQQNKQTNERDLAVWRCKRRALYEHRLDLFTGYIYNQAVTDSQMLKLSLKVSLVVEPLNETK